MKVSDIPGWEEVVAILRDPVLPIFLIVVLAVFGIRLARVLVRQTAEALLDREVTEGTAQELSAIEVSWQLVTSS